jgi:photosynthetic reaction center cytochrome c subunit
VNKSAKSVLAVAYFALTVNSPYTALAQSASAGAAPQKAEDVFKNIQVLRGMPASEMGPTMEFFRTALGMGCTGCHVSEEYAREDKPAKQVARKMMQMTMDINKANFDGRIVVNCYTCHHESPKPVGMFPAIAPEPEAGNAESKETATTNKSRLPSFDQVLDNYVKALGGEKTIEKISTRVERGTATDAWNHKSAMEVLAKGPSKRIAEMHPTTGAVFTLYDGDSGWIRTAGEAESGSQPHDMRTEDIDLAKFEDPLLYATRIKQIFNDLRLDRTEKLDGRDMYVISGHKSGSDGAVVSIELYFDEESGLLRRLAYQGESLFGRVPIFQYDYSDYRDANNVKVPYEWTINLPRAGAAQRFTFHVDEVQQNIPIDDSKFVVPSTLVCKPPRCSGPTSAR